MTRRWLASLGLVSGAYATLRALRALRSYYGARESGAYAYDRTRTRTSQRDRTIDDVLDRIYEDGPEQAA